MYICIYIYVYITKDMGLGILLPIKHGDIMKSHVATIYKAYFSGLCNGISPRTMVLHSTVPPFSNPEIPVDTV